jgi:hypothetical protein
LFRRTTLLANCYSDRPVPDSICIYVFVSLCGFTPRKTFAVIVGVSCLRFAGRWSRWRIPASMRFEAARKREMADAVTLEIFTDYV